MRTIAKSRDLNQGIATTANGRRVRADVTN
jgi:hypothetical protein